MEIRGTARNDSSQRRALNISQSVKVSGPVSASSSSGESSPVAHTEAARSTRRRGLGPRLYPGTPHWYFHFNSMKVTALLVVALALSVGSAGACIVETLSDLNGMLVTSQALQVGCASPSRFVMAFSSVWRP